MRDHDHDLGWDDELGNGKTRFGFVELLFSVIKPRGVC